jgi:hypothetical protein
MKKSDDQKSQPNAQTNQTDNEISPPVVVKSGFPSSAPQSTPQQNQPNDRRNPLQENTPNWCEKWTLILEALGVIGLVVYCIYTYKEWETFDSERKTMESEQMVDERAWVFVESYEQIASDDKKMVQFKIHYKNFGKTVALNLESIAGLQYEYRCIPKKEDAPNPKITMQTLPPGETGFIFTAQIPIEVFPGTPNGKQLYIYGTIWYDDIFGHHHWARHCVNLAHDDSSKEYLFFRPTPNHNSCDDSKDNQYN